MIIIPKDTPTANRSKLSKDELRHFKTLETQFRQVELTWNQTTNEDRVFALQVIQTIRNAPTVCEKSPYEQWLCDMWDAELAIEWPQIKAENQVIAEKAPDGAPSWACRPSYYLSGNPTRDSGLLR